MARVLVTRAAPDAEITAAKLRAMKHEVIVSPVLEIAPVAARFPAYAQAIVFTSAAAARASTGAPRCQVLAVGEATADAARVAGFSDVLCAEGGGAEVVALAARTLDPSGGLVLHLSGEDVSVDVSAVLGAQGFETDRLVVYRAQVVEELSAEARGALAASALDAVLFHSARGAQAFADLLSKAKLTEAVRRIDALCISPRVAEAAAESLRWRAAHAAATPREGALFASLGNPAGEGA